LSGETGLSDSPAGKPATVTAEKLKSAVGSLGELVKILEASVEELPKRRSRAQDGALMGEERPSRRRELSTQIVKALAAGTRRQTPIKDYSFCPSYSLQSRGCLEPCKDFALDRTKMFHVKHFCPIFRPDRTKIQVMP